jgi:hypothetical protein
LSVAAAAGSWGLGDKMVMPRLWLVPLRDAISATVWFVGFFSDKIRWRGLEYRVKKRLLVPVSGGKHPN